MKDNGKEYEEATGGHRKQVFGGGARRGEHPPEGSAEVAERRRSGPGPERILVVDDNRINQKVALMYLKKLGYEADAADSGEDALRALQAATYSVVLMDVRMPGMDGLETTQKIRAREAREGQPSIPIIASTAHNVAGDRENCVGAGMNDYLPKPIRPAALAETLEKWIA